MNNPNGPSFGKKLLVWTSIILSIAFVVLRLQGHINWSWWWVLSPLWIVVALYVIKFTIKVLCVSSWSNSMRKQLKGICDDIVNIIQYTDENNVQEQAKALYEKFKWIDDHKASIKTAIPDPSLKQFSFMLKNNHHKESCYGIAYCREPLTTARRKESVNILKNFSKDYTKLWF